jgi:hypothetical protein
MLLGPEATLVALLVAAYVMSVLAPPPRRALPSTWCVVPLLFGAALLVVALVLWPFAGVRAMTTLAVLAVTSIMPAFWLARAPFTGEDNSDDGGGGGGGSPRPHGAPPSGGIDWTAFDKARRGWEPAAPQAMHARWRVGPQTGTGPAEPLREQAADARGQATLAVGASRRWRRSRARSRRHAWRAGSQPSRRRRRRRAAERCCPRSGRQR